MKKFLLTSIFLILYSSIYSQNSVNYKVELTDVIAYVNDDNGSDEYRFNMSFMGRTMDCIQQSGGPNNWYGHKRFLGDETPTYPLDKFVFSVDFFEDARCGGWDCSFKNSNCGIYKKDGQRCYGDHQFDYKTKEPGTYHTVEITDFCGGMYGIRIRYTYTPFRPNQPVLTDGNANKCGGSTYQIQTSLPNWPNAQFNWYVETNNSGNWEIIPGEYSGTLTVTAPPITSGKLIKRYRAHSIMNATRSLDPSEASQPITIIPIAPTLLYSSEYMNVNNPKCNGESNGSIKINRVGGVGGYIYSINRVVDGVVVWNDNSYDDYPNFKNLIAGKYNLAINYKDGCATNLEIPIVDPPKLIISSMNSPKYNGFNISCRGGDNGSLNASGGGGTPPYTYSVKQGSFIANSNTGSFVGLKAGTYAVTVNDANGCIATGSYSLTEPPSQFLAAVVSTDVRCNGNNDGVIGFNVSGGIKPYNYSIDKGSTFGLVNTFSKLSPGTYICIAKDLNGCSSGDTIVLNEPPKLIVDQDSINAASCFGASDGYVSIIGSGGKGSYKFAIDQTGFQVANTFPLIKGGLHTIRIKDGNNCVDSSIVTIPQPEKLIISFLKKDVQCNGFGNGEVLATVAGGVKPYTYAWLGMSDKDSVINELFPGDYKLTVRDAHNCSVANTASISEPSGGLVAAIVKSINPKCNVTCNGEIEVNVVGGTQPYFYKWNDNILPSDSIIKDLCQGSYNVSVSDSRNCKISASATIADSVQFFINVPDTARLCPGQNLVLNADNPGCNYEWFLKGTLKGTESTYKIESDGDYLLKVTRPDLCYATRTITVESVNDLLKAEFLLPSVVALGDTVRFVEISSPAPDSIQWIFEGKPSIVNPIEDAPELLFGSAGTYKIKLTAFLGQCIDSMSKNITFFVPPSEGSLNDTLGLGLSGIKSIKLYPNPNEGIFKVEIGLDIPQNIEVSIFNFYGNEIKKYTDFSKDNYLIDYFLSIEKGVYLLKVQTATDYKTISFIVN